MAAISHHGRMLERLIATRRQQLVDAMIRGVSEEEYRTMVGQIRGLDEAVRMSEQADFKVTGEFDVGA